MPTGYKYKRTGGFNSDIPKMDLKQGCLIPFIIFVIVIALIIGFCTLFGIGR
jgi:hypothetical protein